jgi:hypothetical protein
VELDEWCPVLTVNARRNMAMSKFCRQYQLLTEAEMKAPRSHDSLLDPPPSQRMLTLRFAPLEG